MEATKCDLSSNQVQLDYMAMLATARTAFAHTRNEMERLITSTHGLNLHADYSLTCKWLLDEAKQLVVAAEVMHTLDAGLDREELEVVNKPEVKES